ncbi:hypothetical protein M0805_001758 [Coniferiporia weirii]|nr:hypothetical protein M0805_001758 [Coniferiporia weirii]
MQFMLATPALAPLRSNGVRWSSNASPGSKRVKGARAFSGSSAARKALPFSLNSNVNFTAHAESTGGKMLRMVMFGKPGAGKGTLSARLVQKYDIVSISTGDLLRQHIAQKTEIGKQAEEIVAQGGLLPDELMLQVLTSKLDSLRDKHWILDGFPRTIGQGELLDAHLRVTHTPLTLLVTLAVPDAILRARIAGRFVHPASGRVYNLNFNPPRVPGRDDVSGEPLVQRADDRPEVYERRLHAYDRETAPLLGYYTTRAAREHAAGMGSAGIQIASLSGETSDEMWPTLEGTVQELFPAVKLREEVAQVQAQRRVPGAKVADAVALLAAAESKKPAGAAKEAADVLPEGSS